MSRPVPITSFRTASLPPQEQFSAWRESNAPILDIAPAGREIPPSFLAGFDTYMAGPLLMGGTAFDGHRYSRDAARVRRDRLNHYQVTLHLSGGYVGRFGDDDVSAGAGDVTLFDFSRPMSAISQQAELLVIAVPREAINFNISSGKHHGLVLRGTSGLGSLLADHMRSLLTSLPNMTDVEATAAAAASVAMISACFQPSAASFAHAKASLAESLINKVRQYIDANLREDITPDGICASFNISRASLYRLFDQFGGVSAYIQNRRLSHIFSALMSPLQNHRAVSDIGREWGFSSETHLSRAFRKAFGMSPREARSVMQYAPPAKSLDEWVPRLRRP